MSASIEFKDKVKVKGHLRIILEEPGKEPEERDLGENLVVNGGLNLLALLLSGNLSNRIQTTNVGTGTVAASKTDSSLGLSVGGSTPTNTTLTPITSGVTVSAFYPAGSLATGTQAITEFGCFTSTSLYNRITFNPISIAQTTSFTFKLDLTFG